MSSPASIHIDESLNTLRLCRADAIDQDLRKTELYLTLSLTPAQCAALRAENRVLRARIANLTRRGATEYQSESSFGSPPSREVGSEFHGLEVKLQKAKELAQATRDNCQKIVSPANRLKERYEKFEGMKSMVSAVYVVGVVSYRILCLGLSIND